MTVGFHPLDARELTDAAEFYEARAPGLGGSFLDEVERFVALLETHPHVGQPRGPTVRTLPQRRFPYTLVYQPQGERLVVLAVAHQRQRPRYWSHRAPQG